MAERVDDRWFISCREATFLITLKRGKPIGFRNRIRLVMHLFICEFCRRFSKQTRMIEKQVKEMRSDEHLNGEEKLELEKLIETRGRELI